MQRIIRNLNNVSEGELTLAHIRTATMVHLPFHLCTGSIFRLDDPDNKNIQIWLRNKVSIPHNTDIDEAYSALTISQISRSSPNDFLTDALIINRRPELREGEFEAIKAKKRGGIGLARLRNPGFSLLNELIAAHQMVRVGPYLSGVTGVWPRMLTFHETIERILVEVILIVDPDRSFQEINILRLFSDIDQLSLQLPSGGTGDLRDYSGDQLAALERGIHRLRSHAFYELKSNAISAMLNGNSVVAIVLACAALEGAHGAYLRLSLRDKIQLKSGKFNSFLDGLLRDQGFFSLVQLSVRVLMEKDERPSGEDLENCLRGVTIRNAIMHASIKGTGEYKLRQFTSSQINDGYSGIMAVYRTFEAAVESRENL